MWLMWVMVALAVAMVVGPVMMMQPSKGMATLAALRTHASQLGLSVHIPNRDDSGNRVNGAVYRMALPEVLRQRPHFTGWRIARQRHAHGIHFHGVWDWVGKHGAPEAMASDVKQQLDALPESIVALECTSVGVGVQWDERCHGEAPEAAVEGIRDLLLAISEKLVAAYAKVPLAAERVS